MSEPSVYVGPEHSHDRFVAGDVVTHCQFIKDQSLWTVKVMHPERLNRFQRMLRATRPKYDCDECLSHCRNSPEWIGWSGRRFHGVTDTQEDQ